MTDHSLSGIPPRVRKVVWLPNDGPRHDRLETASRRLDLIKAREARWAAAEHKPPGRKPSDETWLLVLRAIGAGEKSPADIARVVSRHKARVNDTIKRLRGMGFVAASRVRVGKTYAHEVGITDLGRAALDRGGAS